MDNSVFSATLQNALHSVSNVLQSLDLSLSELEDAAHGQPGADTITVRAEAQMSELRALLSSLWDVTACIDGSLAPAPATTDSALVLEEACTMFVDQGVPIVVGPLVSYQISGDSYRLLWIFEKLLRDAIRRSRAKEQSVVAIRCEQKDALVISIVDGGNIDVNMHSGDAIFVAAMLKTCGGTMSSPHPSEVVISFR